MIRIYWIDIYNASFMMLISPVWGMSYYGKTKEEMEPLRSLPNTARIYDTVPVGVISISEEKDTIIILLSV